MTPLVSVIIPAYNAARFISAALDSVMAQLHPALEIIVVNDGSTDDTAEIVTAYSTEKSSPGKTIHLISQENAGASAAKQQGLNQASGSFIQYLDADDLLAADKIQVQVQYLLAHPGEVAICTTRHFFDGTDPFSSRVDWEPFGYYPRDPLRYLISMYRGFGEFGGMISPNAFLIPREVAEKAGEWNTTLHPSPDEDGEYFCRIILASAGVKYISSTYTYYRKFRNGQSMSALITEQALRNLVKSNLLKHQHLLDHCTDETLIPNINFATFKSLYELRTISYPQFMKLSREIDAVCRSLSIPGELPELSFGGPAINWIARHIHWKLARVLQHGRKKWAI